MSKIKKEIEIVPEDNEATVEITESNNLSVIKRLYDSAQILLNIVESQFNKGNLTMEETYLAYKAMLDFNDTVNNGGL